MATDPGENTGVRSGMGQFTQIWVGVSNTPPGHAPSQGWPRPVVEKSRKYPLGTLAPERKPLASAIETARLTMQEEQLTCLFPHDLKDYLP